LVGLLRKGAFSASYFIACSNNLNIRLGHDIEGQPFPHPDNHLPSVHKLLRECLGCISTLDAEAIFGIISKFDCDTVIEFLSQLRMENKAQQILQRNGLMGSVSNIPIYKVIVVKMLILF
jgi:hypothetical protein